MISQITKQKKIISQILFTTKQAITRRITGIHKGYSYLQSNNIINQTYLNKSTRMKTRVPIIMSDIDGVLKQGINPIGDQAIQALKVVRSELGKIDSEKFGKDDKLQLPFLLLTNRGGMSEGQHAELFNKAMGFNTEENQPYRVTAEQNILNHSALKHQFSQYHNKLILMLGETETIEDIANEYGANKCINKKEYMEAFPEMFHIKILPETTRLAKEHLKNKLGLTDDDLLWPLQCHAIFIFTMPFKWEEDMQLILDLLSTEDGKVAKEMPHSPPATHIPVYVAYNDISYKALHPLPRMVNGCFTTSLKAVYKAVYKGELELELYGKPEVKQFEYAKGIALSELDPLHEVSNYYMIGDNPQSDIRGANKIGWISILVRTGVFQGKDNDEQDPATYVVQDFKEAIKLIFKLEGISTKLLE